jgi:hypothetical protein
MVILTCGVYCPSCGYSVTSTGAGRFLSLVEWQERHGNSKCPECRDCLMPQEFDSSEAGAIWATIHPAN